MKLKYSYLILLACTLIFSECKKKKDPEPMSSPLPATIYKDVCVGDGGTKYVPLAVGNYWTYIGTTQLGNLPVTTTIIKDTVAFGNTYYVATTTSNILPKSYQRYNASGDLVGLDSFALNKNSSHEAILIPQTPVLNASYTNAQGSSTVANTNVPSTPTPSCTYTGLLQMDVVVNGTSLSFYYKKGIGLVYLTCSAGTCNFSSAYLSAMNIY
jgi:hypothetical protein